MPSTPKGYRMTMFCEEPDAHRILWEGARTGTDAAVRKFGADDVSILLAPSILSDSRSRPIHSTNYQANSGQRSPAIPASTLIQHLHPRKDEKAYSSTSIMRVFRKPTSICSSSLFPVAGEGGLRRKSPSSDESKVKLKLG